VRLRILIGTMAALTALASGVSSALAFNPQPDPPGRSLIQEKVQLPIYDSIRIE
jgi:ABC-type spermidine/putrescine transport system permease subunit II